MKTKIDCVEFCKALSDPIRQRIVEMLLKKEMSVNEIVAAFDVSQPTISHHLEILYQAGLVLRKKNGKQILYRTDNQQVFFCCGKLIAKFDTGENLK